MIQKKRILKRLTKRKEKPNRLLLILLLGTILLIINSCFGPRIEYKRRYLHESDSLSSKGYSAFVIKDNKDTFYFKSSYIAMSGNFMRAESNGLIVLYKSGIKLIECEVEQGKKQGIYRFYNDSTGLLELEGNYNKDNKH